MALRPPLLAVLFYVHARAATRIDAMNYGPGQIKLALMGLQPGLCYLAPLALNLRPSGTGRVWAAKARRAGRNQPTA